MGYVENVWLMSEKKCGLCQKSVGYVEKCGLCGKSVGYVRKSVGYVETVS